MMTGIDTTIRQQEDRNNDKARALLIGPSYRYTSFSISSELCSHTAAGIMRGWLSLCAYITLAASRPFKCAQATVLRIAVSKP